MSLLRDTLNIAVELQNAKTRYALALRKPDSVDGKKGESTTERRTGSQDEDDEFEAKWRGHEKKIRVLVIPKSATWYRVVYGDFRHVLFSTFRSEMLI